MIMPDCRTDDVYNSKFLNESDKMFVKGYDFCAEYVIPNFFDNLDIYEDTLGNIEGEDLNFVALFENHGAFKDAFIKCLSSYIEMSRNNLIVSILEQEEYDDGK